MTKDTHLASKAAVPSAGVPAAGVSPSPSPSPSPPVASPLDLVAAGEGVGEATRTALIAAALDLFGRKGFDGTSTRDIAAAAKVNIAGIAYHFGGKAGLHRACGERVADFLAGHLGPFAEVDDALSPDDAARRFEEAVSNFARFMLARSELQTIARFVVREQMDPTATFDVLWDRLIEPRHRRLCRLWGHATGEEAESEGVILAVSSVFGQILFFRVGRATALRRLGWETIDRTNVESIVSMIRESTRALVAARRAGRNAS